MLCKISSSKYENLPTITFIEGGMLEDTGDYIVYQGDSCNNKEVWDSMKSFKQEIGKEYLYMRELK